MANHIFPQPSMVKSIQAGIITMPRADKSATATINAVNTTKSVVLHGGTRCPGTTANPNQIFATVQLTNATTVTATVGGTANAERYVAYTVLEFY
jgi:hypothetical protein